MNRVMGGLSYVVSTTAKDYGDVGKKLGPLMAYGDVILFFPSMFFMWFGPKMRLPRGIFPSNRKTRRGGAELRPQKALNGNFGPYDDGVDATDTAQRLV